MFFVIRLIIGCSFWGFSIALIKKSRAPRKCALITTFSILSVAVISVLALLPLENLFITFNSPEAAYDYISFGKSNVELVVAGDNCDFVINRNNRSDTCLIIPKTEDGWKLGIGLDTKRVVQKISNGITVCVYQYKETNDYFVTVLNTKGGESIVIDNCASEFHPLSKKNNYLKTDFITYFAHISNFTPQYTIIVNGNPLTLGS